MKKILLPLYSLFLLTLTGCGKTDVVSDKPKETIELTAQNFSTYVAINQSSTAISTGSSSVYVTYYAYFKGADYCKFIDCVVEYKFQHTYYQQLSETGTTKLTISGDGEATPFHPASGVDKSYQFLFSVTKVSGTVLVYR